MYPNNFLALMDKMIDSFREAHQGRITKDEARSRIAAMVEHFDEDIKATLRQELKWALQRGLHEVDRKESVHRR